MPQFFQFCIEIQAVCLNVSVKLVRKRQLTMEKTDHHHLKGRPSQHRNWEDCQVSVSTLWCSLQRPLETCREICWDEAWQTWTTANSDVKFLRDNSSNHSFIVEAGSKSQWQLNIYCFFVLFFILRQIKVAVLKCLLVYIDVVFKISLWLFSISTERHRAEVRRAVNDERLNTIACQLVHPCTCLPLNQRLKF